MAQIEQQGGLTLKLRLRCRRSVEILFQRTRTVQVGIPGAIDRPEPTLAEQFDDAIPVIENLSW